MFNQSGPNFPLNPEGLRFSKHRNRHINRHSHLLTGQLF